MTKELAKTGDAVRIKIGQIWYTGVVQGFIVGHPPSEVSEFPGKWCLVRAEVTGETDMGTSFCVGADMIEFNGAVLAED